MTQGVLRGISLFKMSSCSEVCVCGQYGLETEYVLGHASYRKGIQ